MKNLLSSTALCSIILAAFTPSLAYADPISIAVATAASVGAAAVTAGTISVITGTLILKHLAFQAAMQFVASSLAPKPPSLAGLQTGGGTRSAGYSVSGLAPVGDKAIIYGQTKVGGVIIYKEATDNNKFLHIVVALAGHECEEITTVYLNDEALTLDGSGNATAPSKYSGKVRIKKGC